jgi:hypothetical protein
MVNERPLKFGKGTVAGRLTLAQMPRGPLTEFQASFRIIVANRVGNARHSCLTAVETGPRIAGKLQWKHRPKITF